MLEIHHSDRDPRYTALCRELISKDIHCPIQHQKRIYTTAHKTLQRKKGGRGEEGGGGGADKETQDVYVRREETENKFWTIKINIQHAPDIVVVGVILVVEGPGNNDLC